MAAALEILLQDWRERLRAWSAGGSLASAARHALQLGADDPPLLSELTSQWTDGDFSALPPIVLLPASISWLFKSLNGCANSLTDGDRTLSSKARRHIGSCLQLS